MSTWPEVTIVICTYDRRVEFEKTLDGLIKYLSYPADRLQFMIADDHTPGNYVRDLQDLIEAKTGKIPLFSVTPTNLGWGRNVNQALQAVVTPYTFFTEDDYVLTYPLDLKVGIAMMETSPELGYIRYRGCAGDTLVFHQQEARLEEFLPNYQEGVGLPGRGTLLLIDGNSPALYIYTNGPHLKRNIFHRVYGYYAEGLKLGETEESFAHTVKDRMRSEPNTAPWLAILPEWIPMHWDHIGTSYQHTEKDKDHNV